MSSKGIAFPPLDGSKIRIGIVVGQWNSDFTSLMLAECTRGLKDAGVQDVSIEVIEVPGACELVFGAKYLSITKNVDVVVALGCVMKGDTPHFDYVCQFAAHGIQELNVRGKVPIIFGVLTCLTEAQARVRCVPGDDMSHPYIWGKSAVEMAEFRLP